MKKYLGLDLGTSFLKATIIDENGRVIASEAKEIIIDSPFPGHAEEKPETWWNTFCELLNNLSKQTDLGQIAGIGLSGQMHGLVCYGENHAPLIPAIIWADSRSSKEVKEINNLLSEENIYQITGNPVFAGLLLPSLLWLKNNNPGIYSQIRKISSPKDYIALRFTGNLFSEPTDAAATGCFDYQHNCWSEEILNKLQINTQIFPEIISTATSYGGITKSASEATGLPEGIPVFGGSDQSMAAIGCGIIQHGAGLLSISTGGQFLAIDKKGIIDAKRRLHTLNHAINELGFYMAATLSAGLSLKWFKTKILDQMDSGYDNFIKGIDDIPIGSSGLYYLPFLAGERTPYFNPELKGAFIGQSYQHDRLHFIRAIMEGVAFSFRDCYETLMDAGIHVDNIILSGGGAKNATWRQIITDILQVPTAMINIDDHSPFGAAVFAKFAQEGFDKLPAFYEKILVKRNELTPIPASSREYAKLFTTYKKYANYLNAESS